jgi:hypothetical protein
MINETETRTEQEAKTKSSEPKALLSIDRRSPTSSYFSNKPNPKHFTKAKEVSKKDSSTSNSLVIVEVEASPPWTWMMKREKSEIELSN